MEDNWIKCMENLPEGNTPEIESDDSDIHETWLTGFFGGNGDIYIKIIYENRQGFKDSACVRIATSGGKAPLNVKLACADLVRAIEGQEIASALELKAENEQLKERCINFAGQIDEEKSKYLRDTRDLQVLTEKQAKEIEELKSDQHFLLNQVSRDEFMEALRIEYQKMKTTLTKQLSEKTAEVERLKDAIKSRNILQAEDHAKLQLYEGLLKRARWFIQLRDKELESQIDEALKQQ